MLKEQEADNFSSTLKISSANDIFWHLGIIFAIHLGHSGDFGNAAKMVGKMSKSVMQLISIGF